MKSKIKKILLGGMSTATIVAPVATMVACGTTTNTSDVVSDPNAKVFSGDDRTVQQVKDELNKPQDAPAASSNFIGQIKYELTESLYNKEQAASFDYQKAFLRWNIFAAEKDQLALAKEIAAFYDITNPSNNTTASQITLDKNASGTLVYIGKALAITFTNDTYNSTQLFEKLNNLAKDPSHITDDSVKSQFNSKLQTFKDEFKKIVTLKEKLVKIDELKDDKNSGWDSSSLTTDYPKLLKPISKIKDLQTKVYNEAKDAFIDKYKTTTGGAEEWTKERSSKYNGATTDTEAIKYLVNQQVQSVAFGQFTYALDDSFTIEQALATYVDNGTQKHVFPWFDSLGFDTTNLGDKNWATPDPKHQIWTNSKSEFNGVVINTVNVSDQSDVVTPLLTNNVFFLARKSLIANKVLVDLDSPEEVENFHDAGAPILVTHSLLAATPDKTSPNLPWTISKDSIKSMLEYWGGSTVATAKEGVDLMSTLYEDGHEAATDQFNQYVSDDTGSREKGGELGVNTIMHYTATKDLNGAGFVNGFALGVLTAYAQLRNEVNDPTDPDFDLGNAIGNSTSGDNILKAIKDQFVAALPTAIKTQIVGMSTGQANTIIAQWVDSQTDDNVKSIFGNIFTTIFPDKSVKAVYELGANAGGIHTRYMLLAPDTGIHIFNITSESPAWNDKYQTDMKYVAEQKNVAKAKVDWAGIYKTFFTDNEIVSKLLNTPEYADLIKAIPKNNKSLFDEWVKAGYVKVDASVIDDDAKGQLIIDSVLKSIDATRINDESKTAIGSLTPRIQEMITRTDSMFIDPTIDPKKLYDELLKALLVAA